MDAATRQVIETIHQGPRKYVLAVTGGGATAAAQLLSVPGASRNLLEAIVPYHERTLAEFLGRAPEQYCSAETARAMAVRAVERARWLVPGAPVLGVGCTASLATDRPKKGEHRFHVALHADGRPTVGYSLTLAKGSRDREGEEAIVDAVLLNLLADGQDVAARLPLPLLPGETLRREEWPETPSAAALLTGNLAAVCIEPDGRFRTDAPPPKLVLPGSFNPLHEGHLRLGEVAARLTGLPPAFELSVFNADKPPLALPEVQHRARQFFSREPLWLTKAPTFAVKAELFPGAVFVVGCDTAVRIVDPRFYQDSETRMLAALERIRQRGCRFLVAGRVEASGRFVACEELSFPAAVRDLFTGIAESEFRFDISSTQLRTEGSRGREEPPP